MIRISSPIRSAAWKNSSSRKSPATPRSISPSRIRYTSPAELPFRFEWTATVDVLGNVTSTPMKFDQPVAQLTAKAARAKVDAAANGLDVTLTSAQANEAAGLLRTHGTDMYSWNADIFAKFLVRLVTAGGHGVNKVAIAADTAKCIRKWRNVNFGARRRRDPGLRPRPHFRLGVRGKNR